MEICQRCELERALKPIMENFHSYFCGRSGSGKSTLLKNEIMAAIERRDRAVFYIDPHGHDARDLLDAIPRDLTEKTVYFDLSDQHYAVGFNPLLSPVHTLSGLKSIWLKDWGPRMNHILRNSLMLLAETPGTTFEDIPPLFFDHDHRARLLRSVKRTSTRRFWKSGGEFEKKYEKAKDNPDSPILNKIGEILSSDITRNLCQKSPKFDFQRALEGKYVVVVNLSKPTVGDEAAAIFGSLFTTTLRATLLQHPHPCTLYADEFQTYGTALFSGMLSEMRKFGLTLVLAHQFISQISDDLQHAILGNVARKVIFNVDYADAVVLAKGFNRNLEIFNPTVLTELQPHTAMIDGRVEHLPPFLPTTTGRLPIILLRSRENFARKLTATA
jgi:hypothetical protein